MTQEDTTKSKFANHEAKGMISNSFASASLQQSHRSKHDSDDERAVTSSNYNNLGSNSQESPIKISDTSNALRKRKLLISLPTRNSSHKSSRTSLRQINRNREKWTSAALLVAWVFLISSLLATFQLSACGAGAGNKNDKTQGSVTILEDEDGKRPETGGGYTGPRTLSLNGDLSDTLAIPAAIRSGIGKSSPQAVASREHNPCPSTCGNGVCDRSTGKCNCNPGWRGKHCSLCGGKIKLDSPKGWLADAIGNYTVDSKCTWLIEAPTPNSKIRLHLKEFATECGWDHLYVFDGDSVFSDLKAVYSGMVKSNHYSIQRVPEIIGESGHMLLHFYSDVAYNMTGFNITFSINACPSESFDLTCSGHGHCEKESGECVCDNDYKGIACNIPACPNNCKGPSSAFWEGQDAEPVGVCNTDEKRCDCNPDWTGASCSQQISRGYWKSIYVANEKISPRTSHAAIMDDKGSMWVVGGETFTHSKNMVSKFDLTLNGEEMQGTWRPVRAKGDKGPSPRYGHSAVIHDNKIYMYGGTMRSGHTSKELWALNMTSLVWERVETLQGSCMGGKTEATGPHKGQQGPKLCGPIHSMGHTATVQSNRMIVIFGHSPKYGYLDTVQEYHFKNKEWSVVATSGYPVRGGFGHSAVWDEITKRIYVYGGYVSTASTSAQLSKELYSYDPITKRWMLHSSPDQSGWGSDGGLSGSTATHRYLHSAVISNGLMLVFGGNTHNDTSWSHGAKCFSSDALVYDILCDHWYSMPNLDNKWYGEDLARFGHSAVMNNDVMLIYGGFNGVLKNDVLAYIPGQCSIFKSKVSCLTSRVGIKCLWNRNKDVCEAHPPKQRHQPGFDTCIGKLVATLENQGLESDNSKIKGEIHHYLERNSSDICGSIELQNSCSACVSTKHGCVWCNIGGKEQCVWRTCDADSRQSRQGRLSSDFGGQKENDANDETSGKIRKDKGKHVFGKDDFGNSGNYKYRGISETKKSMPANLARGSAATGGGRGYRGIARLDECPNMLDGKGASAVCEAFHICHSCVTVPECEWSIDPKIAKCQKMKDRKHLQSHLPSEVIPITKKIGVSNKNGLNRDSANDRKQNKTLDMKDSRKNNHDIGSNNDPDDNKPQPPLVGNSGAESGSNSQQNNHDIFQPTYEHERGYPLISRSGLDSNCNPACSDRTTCDHCLEQSCMWCKNLRMCTDRNAYLASFPYGQCMDWITTGSCPVVPPKSNDTTPEEQAIQEVCSGYSTCSSCREDPSCGWCDSGTGTGLGVCRVGGAKGPLVPQKSHNSHFTYGHIEKWVAADTCRDEGKTWHFTSCPECQCNGHSKCSNPENPGVCDQPCNDNTIGDHCEKCAEGYFGNPVNGGTCKACECNRQAKTCHNRTGRCYCTTKGIIGDKCDKCDRGNQYYGDPVKDSCFYSLSIDYQFTFNLSKVDDKHLTAISFKNQPTKSDVDVDFSVKCVNKGGQATNAKLNLTVRHNPATRVHPGPQQERVIFKEQNCTFFKRRFAKDEYNFGAEENTTFYVYVYDFETPLEIVVSFSQHPKLDLLQFFITFSTCFLALLLVAAILWKIKQKYDRYRRRQRLFVEMEQMASRPFGTVLVELEKLPTLPSGGAKPAGSSHSNPMSSSSTMSTIVPTSNTNPSPGSNIIAGSSGIDPQSLSNTVSNDDSKINHVRRRRKRSRPSPIALEPCNGNRGAVLSLIVRLPTGGKPYAPNGCTGMAVASALVTLGNPRKPSNEHSAKQSLDDPKVNRKGRKGNSGQTGVDI